MINPAFEGFKRIEELLIEALRVSDIFAADPMLGAIIDEALHRAREMQAELIGPDLPQAA